MEKKWPLYCDFGAPVAGAGIGIGSEWDSVSSLTPVTSASASGFDFDPDSFTK